MEVTLLARLSFIVVVCFHSGSSDIINMTTPGRYSYIPILHPSTINITTISQLHFSVEICNDAHVLLSQYNNHTQPLYEIVIGGWANGKSVIRQARQSKTYSDVKKHSPLSCTEFRRFFVSWEGGVLRVGHMYNATHEGEVFLKYNNTSPFPIHFVSVSGWNKPGTWRLYFNTTSDVTTVSYAKTSTMTTDVTTTEPTDVTTNHVTSTLTSASTDGSSSMTTNDDVSTQETAPASFTARLESTTSSTITTSPVEISPMTEDVTTAKTTTTTDIVPNKMTSTISAATTTDVSTKLTTTIEPKVTRTPPPPQCMCRCPPMLNVSTVESESSQVAAKLLIPAKTTSAARRRRTSAEDDRPSSTAIGVVGVVCVTIPVILIVCSDLISVCRSTDREQQL